MSQLDLALLATDALVSDTALLVSDDGSAPVSISAAASDRGDPPEPLLGVRCAPSIDAVAYPARVDIHGCGGVEADVVGVAVDTEGRVGIAPTVAPLGPAGVGDVALDVGLRALGLATPPSDQPVRAFIDRLWVDRILELALLADLGDPPGWRHISRCHPLADGRVCSPEHLRTARARFDLDWSRCRRHAAAAGLGGRFMSSALADWLDDGSFARRVLATLPEMEPVLADLDELLRPAHAERVRAALRPLLRVR